MYENVNVPEPTCEGWWWRCLGDERKAVYCYRAFHASSEDIWVWREDKMQCGCRHDSPTWTGPIPVPREEPAEDKPPVSDRVLADLIRAAIHDKLEGLNGTDVWYELARMVREKLAGEGPQVVDEEPQTISLAPGASVTFDVDGVRKFVVKADELVLRVDDEQISAEDALRVQAKMQDTARGRPVSDEEGGLRVVLKILVDADKEVHAWVDSAGFIRTEPWSK